MKKILLPIIMLICSMLCMLNRWKYWGYSVPEVEEPVANVVLPYYWTLLSLLNCMMCGLCSISIMV